MAAKAAALKEAPEPADDLMTLEAKGRTFKLRELTAGEYDKCVKLATGEDGALDTIQLLRWMMMKSIVEPENFTAEQYDALPFTVSRKLSEAVNDIHFPPDEDEIS